MQTTLVYQSNDLNASKQLLLDNTCLREVDPSGSMVWKLICDVTHGTVSAYSSGKIVLQCNDKEWAEKRFNILSSGDKIQFVPHIGVDEAGKGDFFGPLVVCALFVSSEDIAKQLEVGGVRDSKTLSDSTILKLSELIIKLCPDFSVVTINNKKLTEMVGKFKNMNKVLAWAHSQAIKNVIDKVGGSCKLIVIDQFSKNKNRVLEFIKGKGIDIEVVQRHKGESDIAVAAASIMARGVFVKEIEKLSRKYGQKLPKGSSDVIDSARAFIIQHGRDELDSVAKTTFKITKII